MIYLKSRTFWQWLAFVCFWLGLVSNVIGWITKSWVFVILNFVFYGTVLYCIEFKPVGGKS